MHTEEMSSKATSQYSLAGTVVGAEIETLRVAPTKRLLLPFTTVHTQSRITEGSVVGHAAFVEALGLSSVG